MNYRLTYRWLMTRAREPTGERPERHHVKPRCLGGSDHKRNVVRLTYREHFLAHWLLVKMNKGDARKKMVLAFRSIAQDRRWRKVQPWQRRISRSYAIEHTKAARENMSRSALNKNISPEAEARRRSKISEGLKGREFSTESRAKSSKTQRGKKLSDDHVAALRAASQRRWARPEERAKMSEAARRRFEHAHLPV